MRFDEGCVSDLSNVAMAASKIVGTHYFYNPESVETLAQTLETAGPVDT